MSTDAFGNETPDVLPLTEAYNQNVFSTVKTLENSLASSPDLEAQRAIAADRAGVRREAVVDPKAMDQSWQRYVVAAEMEPIYNKTHFSSLLRYLDQNAKMVHDDLPMVRKTATDFVRAYDSAQLDERPELSWWRAYGAGGQSAAQGAAVGLLAIPAFVESMFRARDAKYGPMQAFDALTDYDRANDAASSAFKPSLTSDVAQTVGAMPTYIVPGIGAARAAQLAGAGAKAAITASAMVQAAQTSTQAVYDFSKSNIERGVAPSLTPSQYAMAAGTALVTAATTRAFGAVGSLAFLSKADKLPLAAVGKGAIEGGIEEAGQGLFEAAGKGDRYTVEDAGYAGVLGAVFEGAAGVPAGLALEIAKVQQNVAKPAANAIAAVNHAEAMANALSSAESQKLAQRAPARLVQQINDLSEGRKVYFSAEDWTKVWTDMGLSPVDAIAKYGAETDGSTIEMSAGDFVVNTIGLEGPVREKLLETLREKPDSMSLADAQATFQLLEEAEAEAGRLTTPTGADEDSDVIVDKLTKQQVAAGVKEDDAKRYSTLVASAYRTAAERYNAGNADKLSASQLFDLKKVSVSPNLAGDTSARGTYDPTTGTISLMKGKSDRSTMLHESAHAFLELNSFLAEQDKSGYFKQQQADFRQWVERYAGEVASSYNERKGTSLTADDILATAFDESGKAANEDAWAAQHEYFARGFEKWLSEGKAPDPEMRGLFRRFADWLVKLYKDMQVLGVSLDDQSRAMFRRLVAVDDAIKAADAEADVRAITEEAARKLGFTESEMRTVVDRQQKDAAERLGKMVERQAKLISASDRRARADFRSKRFSEIMDGGDGVPPEYLMDPVLRGAVLRALITGDDSVPGATSHPLFNQWISESSAKLIEIDQYAEMQRRGWLRDNGISIEDAAMTMLADNPVSLVDEMLTAPEWKEAVDRKIDAEEEAKFGPLIQPDKARELAMDAAYGHDRQASVGAIVKMMRSVLRKANVAMTKGQMKEEKTGVKADAKQIQAALDIDEVAIEAAQYAVAERLTRDKLRPAKWRALANRYAKEANKALDKGDAVGFYQSKVNEKVALKRAEVEDELRRDYDRAEKKLQTFVKNGGKALASGPEYAKFANNLLAKFGFTTPTTAANPANVPAIRSSVANSQPYVSPEMMPVTLLLDLAESLDSIVSAMEDENKMFSAAKKASIAANAADLEAEVRLNAPRKRPSTNAIKTKIDKFARIPMRVSSYLTILDGGKPGKFTELFMDQLQAGTVKMTAIGEKYAKEMIPAIQGLSSIRRKVTGTGRLETSGTTVEVDRLSMSEQEKVMFAGHWGSESGRKRAKEHLSIMVGDARVDSVAKAILDSMGDKEKAAVKLFWKINDELFEQSVAQHNELHLPPPKAIKAAPFRIGDEQFDGGYVTLRKLDKIHSANLDQIADDKTLYSDHSQPSASFEKSRAMGDVRGELDLSVHVQLAHVGEVARVLAFRPLAKDISRLWPKISQTIADKFGADFSKETKEMLDLAIVGTAPPSSVVERGLAMLRRNSTAAALMYNMNSAVSQLLGMPASIAEIGPKAFASGVQEYASNPMEANRKVRELHKGMAQRLGMFDPNVQDAQNAASLNKYLAAVSKAGWLPMHFMQAQVDTITFLGAYEKARSEYPNKGKEWWADRAYAAVNNSQGGAQDIHLTKMHQNQALRLLTVFGTAFNSMANQLYVPFKTGDKKKFANTLFWLMGASVVAQMGLEALRGGAPDDEEYLDWYLRTVLKSSLDLNPITRAAAPTVMYGRVPRVPGIGPAESAMRLPRSMIDGEWGDVAKHTLRMLSGAYPIPTVQMERLATAAVEADGDEALATIRKATLGEANPAKR